MAAGYQYVRGAQAPCGHVHGSEKTGAKRDANNPVPEPERYHSPCFCGAEYIVEVRPILMVVGYEAVITGGTNVKGELRG